MEERLTHGRGSPAESGLKGGEYQPTRDELFARKVAAVLDQMHKGGDDYLRVTLFFLLLEYRSDGPALPVPLAQIAERSGLSRGRAREALAALEADGWVEPVGRSSWRLLPIQAARS